MSAAKCVTVFVVVALLIVGLILYRKKTNQILLSVAIALSLLGAYRLFQIRETDDSFSTVVVIAGAMGLVWLVSLLSNRAAARRARAEKGGVTARSPQNVHGGGGREGN